MRDLAKMIGVRGSPARGYFPPARVEGAWSKTGNSSNRRRRRRRRRPPKFMIFQEPVHDLQEPIHDFPRT